MNKECNISQQDLNFIDVINALDSIKDLYEGGLPTKILQEQILKDQSESKNISKDNELKNNELKNNELKNNELKNNELKNPEFKNDKLNNSKQPFAIWGNLEAKILILGSLEDSYFSKDNEFFNSILKNGLKFDENSVCFLSVENNFNENALKSNSINFDITMFKKILCLGKASHSFLEKKLNSKILMSDITKIDNTYVLATYDIISVYEAKDVKRLFWNDLQSFLRVGEV